MSETILNNRYQLDSERGRGGMGVVYKGRDLLLDREVAIKVLNKTGLGTEGRVRLLREAQAVARLNHPNIITVYDAGEADGVPYIVMELLQGGSLYERRTQDLDELLEISQQVCAALEHAHAHGIIHRDLKPENIIVTGAIPAPDVADAKAEQPAGGPEDLQVKLTDFGLARSVASRVTAEGGIVGTVFYLAPEQALGQELDGRTDLYALGVMLYELIAGRLPFSGDDPLTIIAQHLHAPVVPPSTYRPDIPPSLEALILKLLNKKPEDRPSSAAEVGRTLERIARRSPELTTLEEGTLQLSPLDRLVRGRLVGRDRELSSAKVAWQRATVNPDLETEHVLLISGESGVGKTPLVRAIRALAEVSRGRVLTAECYVEGRGAPYAPVAQIMRDVLAEPAVPLDLPEMVLADLVKLAPDLGPRHPGLRENPPLDPQAEQQRLFEGLFIACTALISRGRPTSGGLGEAPLLLVVEDVQWADGGTLALLRHLARRSRSTSLKLLILLTYRESELAEARALGEVLLDFTRERLATHIKLVSFDRAQTAELLQVMFQEAVPSSFVDEIYRETEGNLFYIEEVCRALIEEGRISCAGGCGPCWSFPQGAIHTQIPQNVRLAIQARVAKLPAEAQDVLRLASVIGREFDYETLRRASELGEDSLVEALEAAQRAQLIAEVQAYSRGKTTPHDTFVFSHNLILAALRESLSSLRRRRLHRRVAETIEALTPDDDAALAYHYSQAGDGDHALTHYRSAGDRARQVYANEEAIRAYSEALALAPEDSPEHFDVLLARAQTYHLIARRAEEQADIAWLLTQAERLRDSARSCDALLLQADSYLQTDPFLAPEPAQRAAEIARRMGDPVREGQALRRLGFAYRLRSDPVRGRAYLEAAAERFRTAGLPGEAAAALHMLSLTLGDLAEYEAALQASAEAVALSRQAEDRRQEGISLRRMAIVYLDQLRFAEALPFADAGLALHRAVGDRTEETHALKALGIIHAWQGHPIESEAHLRASLELAEAISSRVGALNAIENLNFVCYGWRGEYAAAIAFLEEQCNKPYLATSEYARVILCSRQADYLLRLGQLHRAEALMREVMILVERLAAQGTISAAIRARCLSFAGRVEGELGEFDRAQAHLDAAMARIDEVGSPPDAAGLRMDRARLALLVGGDAEARLGLEMVELAIQHLSKGIAWVLDQAEAHCIAAELHLALGEIDAALADSTAAVKAIGSLPFARERFLYAHARALEAAGRSPEAQGYVRQAHERVLLVASRTANPEWQRSWLEDVRANREIIAAWRKDQGG